MVCVGGGRSCLWIEKNIQTPAIVMAAGLTEEDHATGLAVWLWKLST